jgi:hypothetical protein
LFQIKLRPVSEWGGEPFMFRLVDRVFRVVGWLVILAGIRLARRYTDTNVLAALDNILRGFVALAVVTGTIIFCINAIDHRRTPRVVHTLLVAVLSVVSVAGVLYANSWINEVVISLATSLNQGDAATLPKR